MSDPQTEAPVSQPPSAQTALDTLHATGTTPLPPFQSNLHCVSIIGQIEGHMLLPPQNKTTRYEHLLPQLIAVEENPAIEGLLVVLNTMGGDVECGLALAEIISSLSKPTVSLVLGGGHSIGAAIAVSADYSFIAPSATMTIHPIRLTGLVIGVPQTYEYMDKMQARVIDFVLRHSGISEEQFRCLMFKTGDLAQDVGTVLVGADAVNCGLLNAVGGIGDAVNKLHQMIHQQGGIAH